MTNKEAAKTIVASLHMGRTGNLIVPEDVTDNFLDAICLAISVLMKQEKEGKHLCKCQNDA